MLLHVCCHDNLLLLLLANLARWLHGWTVKASAQQSLQIAAPHSVAGSVCEVVSIVIHRWGLDLRACSISGECAHPPAAGALPGVGAGVQKGSEPAAHDHQVQPPAQGEMLPGGLNTGRGISSAAGAWRSALPAASCVPSGWAEAVSIACAAV